MRINLLVAELQLHVNVQHVYPLYFQPVLYKSVSRESAKRAFFNFKLIGIYSVGRSLKLIDDIRQEI